MLQKMHDKSQSWFMWVIVGVIVVVFGLWGFSNFFVGDRISHQKTAVKVNGDIISTVQMAQAVSNAKQRLGAASTATDSQVRLAVQNAMVDQILLEQEARHSGLTISPSQVSQYIAQMPQFSGKDHRYSPQLLESVLQRSGMSINSLRVQVAQDMVLGQLRYGLFASEFVLPTEVSSFQSLITQTRDVSYLLISPSQFKSNVNISKAAIASYYKSHPSEFMTPEQVQLSYIELSVNQLKDKVKVSEDDTQAYYNSHKDSYREVAKPIINTVTVDTKGLDAKQANKLKVDLKAIAKSLNTGQSFAQVQKGYAKTNSLANSLANSLVFAGKVESSSTDKAIRDAAVALAKPGSASGVISSDSQLVVVQLVNVPDRAQIPYAKVKDSIKALLINDGAEREYAELGNKLDNLAFENPNTLSIAANELGLQVKTSNWFSKKTASEGVLSNPAVIKAAYSGSVLKDKNNSAVINISSTDAVVIRVKSYKPEVLEPLVKVSTTIEQTLKARQADIKAKQLAAKLLTALRAPGAKVDQVAKLNNLSWTEVASAARVDSRLPKAVLLKAFSMPNPVKGSQGVFSQTTVAGKGAYVLDLKLVKNAPANAEQVKAYDRQLMSIYSQASFSQSLARLRSQAKITVVQQNKTALN